MSEPTPTSAEPHVLTADDLFDLSTYDFPVADGPGGRPCVFKVRRIDVLTQFFENLVPDPLQRAAAEVMAQIREWAATEGDGTFASLFERLDGEQKRTLLDQMRAHACAVVLTPKLVPGPDAQPGEFPVTLLSGDLLWRLWTFTPPAATVRRLSEVAAADFRGPAEGGPAAAAPAGGGVRPATLDLRTVGAPARQP